GCGRQQHRQQEQEAGTAKGGKEAHGERPYGAGRPGASGQNVQTLFGGYLVGLLARARPGIEKLPPIGLRHLLGDAVIFGPTVFGKMEGPEDLVEPWEMNGEIDVERLALQPVVPMVETRGRNPMAKAIEISADIGVEQRRPDI